MLKERRFLNEEEKGFDGVIEKKGVRQLCMTQLFLVEPRQTLHPSRSRFAFKAERPKRQITGSKQAIAIEGSSFRSKADIAVGHPELTASYICT